MTNMRALLSSRHFLNVCVLLLATLAVVGAMLLYAYVEPATVETKKLTVTSADHPVREN
jgi:hypothetical protein